jgi:hypothetical protein
LRIASILSLDDLSAHLLVTPGVLEQMAARTLVSIE